MQVCFLYSSHDIKAVKHFSDTAIQSYPQIKTFDSATFDIEKTQDGLEQKTALLQEYAKKGGCLLKGVVTEPLKKASRKNSVDKDALTENIILDIDGIIIPDCSFPSELDKGYIQMLAELIIAKLPSCFHNVSYIVHASSSMGLKNAKVSLHLDFMLTRPIHPKTLKDYLIWLNFNVQLFHSQLDLSASGTALHYPVDRCLADNSRLIYIGHPVFSGSLSNPIPNLDDRIFLVKKNNVSFDLANEITDEVTHTKLQRAITAKINELRQIQGLPKRTEKIQPVTKDGYTTYVVTNPDQIKMHPVDDRGDWVTYNVNDGDSAAYYVYKLNPSIVYNFKGEPFFLFEQADPDTYQWHIDKYIINMPDEERNAANPVLIPLVFRDYKSNAYYNGLFNTSKGQMESINRATREGLADFMVQHGGVMPENVPIWNYEFIPTSSVSVDFRNRFVNKYVPSELMRSKPTMKNGYEPLTYDNGFQLEEYCPTIFKLLYHVVGSSMKEYLHFVNWLAAALQLREKLQTAWILQGVQGTGKGQLFERIIGPLVGQGIDQSYPYFIKLRQDNIEDQFNQWEETALFAALDEFRISDSTKSHKLFNKIKNMITDEENTVRGMRENTRRVKLYTNYLIYANDQDMMYMPDDDRRFNVAPRQVSKLDTAFPDLHDVLHNKIPDELPVFARIMREFVIDERKARTCLDNEAKRAVRYASATSVQEFIDALKTGDLEYFLPILDLPYAAPGTDYTTPAKLILTGIIRDWDDTRKTACKLTTDQLRILYNCTVGRVDNVNKFGKLLAHNGLETKHVRVNKVTKRGVDIFWSLRYNKIEDLQRQYVIDAAATFDKVVPFNKRESP